MYKVKYGCSNCNRDFEVDFPIGSKAFEADFPMGSKAPDRITCPCCGCYPAYKKWK